MITEDYCSYELSKLLKEKGFDFENQSEGIKKLLSLEYNEVYFTIAHALAMKWLREKGIYINIIYTGEIYHYFVVNIFDSNNEVWYKNSIEESTYEEANEAAIKYSLENLI